MRRTFSVLAIAICVAISATSSTVRAGLAYFDPLYGVQVTSNVVYGTGKTTSGSMSLLMDVYQPTDIGNGKVLPTRAAVVIQDGGAWTSGDKTNGRVVTPAMYLAQRGYTVFITDYRQVGDSPVSGPGPWQNLNPGSNSSLAGAALAIYPSYNVIRAGVEDFATAISFVRSHASTYGIDPNRIGIAGGSAGGVNALDLQYNNNPVDPSYRAQAVVALVATMYGDWSKVQAGGPPLFMWNNALDPLIWYSPDVEPNLHNRLLSKGIYYEQWMEDPNLTDHNVHYEQHPLADTNDPYLAGKYGDQSENALERMRDFLATKLAGGPVVVNVPEPATVVLAMMGGVGVAVISLRNRVAARRAKRHD
jgi:acetyl esterase/lipase